MKKIISILIIVAMMLSSAMLACHAFAEGTNDMPNGDFDITEEPTEDIAGAREALAGRTLNAKDFILTDYTDETAEALSLAIGVADDALADEKSEYAVILNAIIVLDDAIAKLKPKKADTVEIRTLYN